MENPRIMYDQTQFMPLYLIDAQSIYINDAIYTEIERISGYAPDPWVLFTQRDPESFWFGAYEQDALQKEAEMGYKNFCDAEFLQRFEASQKAAYELAYSLQRCYFFDFFQKEREALTTRPHAVVAFLQDIQKAHTTMMAWFLLTQPQRFFLLEERVKSGEDDDALRLLTQNGRYLTYVSRTQQALVELAFEVHQTSLSLSQFINQFPEKYQRVLQIVRELGFLQWGFLGGELLDEENALKKIEDFLQHPKELEQEKLRFDEMEQKINKRRDFLSTNQEEKYRIADILGQSAVIRFDLQTLIFCTSNYVRQFLDHIPEVFAVQRQQLDAYEFPEIIALIMEGVTVHEELLDRRQHGYARIFSHTGSVTYCGTDAHEKLKDILVFREREIANARILQGAAASLPKDGQRIFRGRAFVLTTAFGSEEKVRDLQEGDILVATQTHPQIVPAMKRALAIVTDEGGVTCHAAIVSRELGKPCLIGTKLATKVIKTGDMIEVNLTDGIVKKVV